MGMHRTAERFAQVTCLSLAMFSGARPSMFDEGHVHDAPSLGLTKLLPLQSGGGVIVDSRPTSLGSGVVSVVTDRGSSHALFVSSWVESASSAFTGEPTNINISFGIVNSAGKLKYTPTLSFASTISPETSLNRITNKAVSEKGFFSSGSYAYVLFDARFDPSLRKDQKSNGEVVVQFIGDAGVTYKGVYPNETTISVSQVSDVAVIVTPRQAASTDGSEGASTHIQVVSGAGKIIKDGDVRGFGVPDGWTKNGQMIFSGGSSIDRRTPHVLDLNTFQISNTFAESSRFIEKPVQPFLTMSQGFLSEAGREGSKIEVASPDAISIFLEGSKNSARNGIVSVNPDGTAVFFGTTKISSEQLNAFLLKKNEYAVAAQCAQDISAAMSRLTNGDTDALPSADELKRKLAEQGIPEDVLAKFVVQEYQTPINDPGTPVLSIDAGGKRIFICADGSRKVTSI